jgi:hypothetical protein
VLAGNVAKIYPTPHQNLAWGGVCGLYEGFGKLSVKFR